MKEEQLIKVNRIREYLLKNRFSGMVLARQDNFSWLSLGGNNKVVVPKEQGYGVLVITHRDIYMIAQVMDGRRIMEEELSGMSIEYVPLKWYEDSIIEKAVTLAGDNPVGDVWTVGLLNRQEDIYDLHYPLTGWEVERLREAGRVSDEILNKVAIAIKPGMVDYEIEAMLLYEYALHNMQCDVLLIGTDNRIFRYRHPSPIGKTVGKYVFLHSAIRYKGLHCNVTRSIYFGDSIPENIGKAYDAASYIQAYCFAQCERQAAYSDILKGQKALLKQFGYEGEWEKHYPGGRTGYMVCQADLALRSGKKAMEQEAYDWFITITGAKVEELSVNCNGRLEIFSHTGQWVYKELDIEGRRFSIPQIMVR